MAEFPLSLKYPFVVSAAMLATLLSLALMQLLIRTDLSSEPEAERPRITTSLALETRLQKLEEPERRDRSRLLPTEAPPNPDGITPQEADSRLMVMAQRPDFSSLFELFDDNTAAFDIGPPASELVPLYVVHPTYPFRAVLKEIEGFVVINFGVRANGTVRNPVIVESSPGSLFDDAALSAIDKFRFQPRMLHGEALDVDNLQMRFVFRLEDGAGTALALPARYQPQ